MYSRNRVWAEKEKNHRLQLHYRAVANAAAAPAASHPPEKSSSSSSNGGSFMKQGGNVLRYQPKGSSSAGASSQELESSAPASGNNDVQTEIAIQFGSINPRAVTKEIPCEPSLVPSLKSDVKDHNQGLKKVEKAATPVPSPPPSPVPPALEQLKPNDKLGAADDNCSESKMSSACHTKREGHAPAPSITNVALQMSSAPPMQGVPPTNANFQPQVSIQSSSQVMMPMPSVQPPQMKMAIPLGMGPQPPQVLIPGVQTPWQQQPMMHRGHNIWFAPPNVHHLPTQLGNLATAHLIPHHQSVIPREVHKSSVKITDPVTHQDLVLGRSADISIDSSWNRPLTNNVNMQPQAMLAVNPFHHANYHPPVHPNMRSPHSPYFPPCSNFPLRNVPQVPDGIKPNFQVSPPVSPPFLNPIPGAKFRPPALHAAPEFSSFLPSNVPSFAQVAARPLVRSHAEKTQTTAASGFLKPATNTAAERQMDHRSASETSVQQTIAVSESVLEAPTVSLLTTAPQPVQMQEGSSVSTASVSSTVLVPETSIPSQGPLEASQSSLLPTEVNARENSHHSEASACSGKPKSMQSTLYMHRPKEERNREEFALAEISKENDVSNKCMQDCVQGTFVNQCTGHANKAEIMNLPSLEHDKEKVCIARSLSECCGHENLKDAGQKMQEAEQPDMHMCEREEALQSNADKKTGDVTKKSKQSGELQKYLSINGADASHGEKHGRFSEKEYSRAMPNQESGQGAAELDDSKSIGDPLAVEPKKLEHRELTPKTEISSAEEHKKRYTRGFLLTFVERCCDLPLGFELPADVAVLLLRKEQHTVNGGSHGSVSKSRSSRSNYRGSGSGSAISNRWMRPQDFTNLLDGTALAYSSLNPMADAYPGYIVGDVPQRNLRGSTAVRFGNGILSRAVHAVSYQASNQDSGFDAERWRQGGTVQKWPVTSFQTPVMHKAEKKYEVGKVSDEEEAKQRQLKGVLNKLTPQNFEKLFTQVKEMNIDSVETLSSAISQIFDKALMEPTFCEMYASFCSRLASALPDFFEGDVKVTFRRLLLNKCQEEFERGERDQAQSDNAEEGETKQSKVEREERRLRVRRRMLGNIRLIGELYKKKMLTEKIMHECIKKLLGKYQVPDEEDLEALCKLMSTIGEMIDRPKAKEHMDAYFEGIVMLSANPKLSSRVRCLLVNVVELRENNWKPRMAIEGPKKIDEVHKIAAGGRGSQPRRQRDQEPRKRSVPDNGRRRSSTFGALQLSGAHEAKSRTSVQPVDTRSFNGSSMNFEGRLLPRNQKQGSISPISKDPPSIVAQGERSHLSSPQDSNVEKRPAPAPLSEEALHEKSILAIREFYSAKDEQEVALCMKELNCPSFYPCAVSLWITDSFEKKDKERDLLAKLLVELCQSHGTSFTQAQLIEGFQSVLSNLEDAMTDAPKAAEFLGRIFAKVIVEGVVTLGDVGRLLQEGGESGRLLEAGIASRVLCSTLEAIRVERGESAVDEIRASSDLRLEDFRTQTLCV